MINKIIRKLEQVFVIKNYPYDLGESTILLKIDIIRRLNHHGSYIKERRITERGS